MDFKNICKMTQDELKCYLSEELLKFYDNKKIVTTTTSQGFIYAQGKFPVLLIAHLDTVHKEPPKEFTWNNKTQALSSPQGIGGDDRCGVYMILKILKKYNCSVLFCEDEEIGGIGADNFVRNIDKVEEFVGHELDFNYIIEFDRANANDAVFYDCDNPEFEKFITKDFYKTAWGSFSDISIVAPALGIAAVNLSCGYYKAHTKNEYVVMPEMEKSISEAMKILERTKDKFEYIEAKYDDYGYGYYDSGYWSKGNSKYGLMYYMFEYIDTNGDTQWDMEQAMTEEEAVGTFLIKNPNICYNDIIDVDVDYDIY